MEQKGARRGGGGGFRDRGFGFIGFSFDFLFLVLYVMCFCWGRGVGVPVGSLGFACRTSDCSDYWALYPPPEAQDPSCLTSNLDKSSGAL